MATELTAPVVTPDVTHQGITEFTFYVPHDAMAIDKPNVRLRYSVTTWAEDGTVISRASRKVPFSSWPTGVKTDVKSIYSRITTDAKNVGLIDPGTDEPLE